MKVSRLFPDSPAAKFLENLGAWFFVKNIFFPFPGLPPEEAGPPPPGLTPEVAGLTFVLDDDFILLHQNKKRREGCHGELFVRTMKSSIRVFIF